MLMQISSGSGPAECELAVLLFFRALRKEFPDIELVDERKGSVAGGRASIRFRTRWELPDLKALAGTIQWICPSPLRPHHGRKNWFIDLSILGEAPRPDMSGPVRFERFRSGGKGGQNVNKVETGVRLVHTETGIAVRETGERSQWMNRRRAEERLQAALGELRIEAEKKDEEGAGLSAESGIPTYRDPQSNWQTTNAFDSEEAKRNPQLFLRGTNERIREWKDAKPNAAHAAIADFARRLRGRASILHITQNIDALSEDAGDTSVFHLHGSILKSRCRRCGAHFPRLAPYSLEDTCPACGRSDGAVRPDIVLFGEVPYGMDWIPGILREADIFIAVGTSLIVYPAARFVAEAMEHGCLDRFLITKDLPDELFTDPAHIDLDEADSILEYTKFFRGSAARILPQVLEGIAWEIEARMSPKLLP